MTEKMKNALTGALFLAFGIFLYVEGSGVKHMMKNDMGSGFFPKVLGIAIIAIALMRLITALRMPKSEQSEKKPSDMPGGWLTIVLVCAFVFAFNEVGFLISTAVYLFLQMLILTPKEKRKLPLLTLISVVTPLFIYTMFVYALNIPLPKGIFYF